MSAILSQDRLVAAVISYACRMDAKKALTPTEGKRLAQRLKKASRDMFGHEMADDKLGAIRKPGPPLLFAMQKTYFLGVGQIEMATLHVCQDNFTLFVPRRLNGANLSLYEKDFWLQDEAVNNLARHVALSISDVLEVSLHRAGKIYELHFAPVAHEEKAALWQGLCPGIKERVSEFDCTVTFVRKEGDKEYNHHVCTSSSEMQPVVSAKIDINNRDMQKALDPNDISNVYSVADKSMPKWFFDLMPGGET